MQTQALEGGFQEPAVAAAYAFRALMDVMARPGTIHSLTGANPPAPLSTAAGICLLTLCDHETPVFLANSHDHPQIREWIAFHTGAPITDAGNCLFAVGAWESILPLNRFPVGTPEYPDRSATLVVEVDKLSNSGTTLSGPGIRDRARLSLPDRVPFQQNHKQYPLGLDFFFTNNRQVAALPRSVEIRACT